MIDLTSPTSVTILTASVIAIIGAMFAGIVSVVTAWRTVASKVSAIEGHVNSASTAAQGRERLLAREIEMLREMIVELRANAGLLAQQVAVDSARQPTPVAAPAVIPDAAAESLERIDDQTAAIERNTEPPKKR